MGSIFQDEGGLGITAIIFVGNVEKSCDYYGYPVDYVHKPVERKRIVWVPGTRTILKKTTPIKFR